MIQDSRDATCGTKLERARELSAEATVDLSKPVDVPGGSPTDVWVATLLRDIITDIALSLDNCDIDLSLVETLQCSFVYDGLPVTLRIELGRKDA